MKCDRCTASQEIDKALGFRWRKLSWALAGSYAEMVDSNLFDVTVGEVFSAGYGTFACAVWHIREVFSAGVWHIRIAIVPTGHIYRIIL